jgi:phosphorylcholine metabolism protein LicD
VKTKRKGNTNINRNQRNEEGIQRIEVHIIVLHCNNDKLLLQLLLHNQASHYRFVFYIEKCGPYVCFFVICVLFVFETLIHNYYWFNSNFYNRLSYENSSIEQALEQISTCTSNDRSRQRVLLHILQKWTDFTRQHYIRYWIAYGTLVGYVHHHALLPHDSNIDLFIMAQDTSQLLELSQQNFLASYELKIHPQWYLVEQTKRSYFYSEGIDFIAPNARFINSKDNLYLNIWPIYDYNPNEARIKKNSTAMLTAYDKNYQWKSSPKEWTFPLRECQFSGMKVWYPAEPEKLVTNIYGQISVNMSSKRCVNGSWVETDEYRSTEKKMKKNNESVSTKQFTNT